MEQIWIPCHSDSSTAREDASASLGPCRIPLRCRSTCRRMAFHVAQVTEVAEHPLPVVGDADFTAYVRGTRTEPSITYVGALANPGYGDLHMAGLTVRGS